MWQNGHITSHLYNLCLQGRLRPSTANTKLTKPFIFCEICSSPVMHVCFCGENRIHMIVFDFGVEKQSLARLIAAYQELGTLLICYY